MEAQPRVAGEQGKRVAPRFIVGFALTQAHPPPLAPTVPPHNCLSRHLLAPTDHVVGSASIPERIRTGPAMFDGIGRGNPLRLPWGGVV
ncbi:MAG TPA: hypothetical protein VKY19_16590 [Ktedonosporobacter sp.]|nr:hypothetical protein [Ktedonosporobacter sp.]